MKIYNVLPSHKPWIGKLKSLRLLKSYFYIKNWKEIPRDDFVIDFFLDSGAFSAWTKNETIDIKKYAEFIKKHKHNLTVYANLDDIVDPLKSQKNQEYLESVGLNPMPVFHYKEPVSILKDMIDKYDYIALGGMVPIPSYPLDIWLREIFSYICDEKGYPKVKIHGFGMTTKSLVTRYPWFSIDSTSPIIGAAMGRIYTEHGEINLSRNSGIIPLALKEYCKKYISQYTFEQLRDDYKIRTICNIEYLQRLEKKLTENPPIYICKQPKLL